MPDIYQPKLEHLLLDPLQGDPLDAVHPPYNTAKLAEMKALVKLAGDNPAVHAYPTGTLIANAATGNGNSTVLIANSRWFTNDILLRIVTTVGATPTATFNIQSSKDNSTFNNVNYALIATPNTLVSTAITITTAQTSIYRIPAHQAKYLRVAVSANTNVTYTIDVLDFGGVPTNG